MKSLRIQGSKSTFTTILDKKNNFFEISGYSRPENINNYFEPIFKWIDDYVKNPNKTTVLNLKLEYYDTSSAKVLLRLLFQLNDHFNKGMDIKIKWFYQEHDEDILESGEELTTLVDIPFEFIPYK